MCTCSARQRGVTSIILLCFWIDVHLCKGRLIMGHRNTEINESWTVSLEEIIVVESKFQQFSHRLKYYFFPCTVWSVSWPYALITRSLFIARNLLAIFRIINTIVEQIHLIVNAVSVLIRINGIVIINQSCSFFLRRFVMIIVTRCGFDEYIVKISIGD